MKNKFFDILSASLLELNYPLDNIIIQIPKNPNHGDFTTNYPLINSKKIGKNPIEIAELIVNNIKSRKNSLTSGKTHPYGIVQKLASVIAIEKFKDINQTGSVDDSCLIVIAT